MILKSLLRALGLYKEQPDVPQRQVVQAATAASRHPQVPGLPKKAVVRQEILDSRCRIAGYAYRPLNDGISAEIYLDSLQRVERINEFARKRLSIIRISPELWRGADFTTIVEANTVFQIHRPAESREVDSVRQLAESLRAAGCKMALNFELLPRYAEAAAGSPDLVFFDLAAQPLDAFEEQMRLFANAKGTGSIAVCNVQSWAEQRFSLSLGAHYFLGNFVDADDDADRRSGEMSESRSVIFDMLRLLRSNAETQALAEVAKRDPATSLKLLSMAKSPLYGHARELTGIDQAIVLLGRDTLYRWLTMLLFRSGGESQRLDALLEHALYRAHFMEQAGKKSLSRKECEELFLIGLLSYANVLLDIPMHEVLQRMKVAEEVHAALLEHKGKFWPYLDLVLSCQRGESEHLAELGNLLALDHDEIASIHGAALEWANSMLDA